MTHKAKDLFSLIVLIGRLAGLLHDLGKAIISFQLKIRGLSASLADPVRHERLSAHVCCLLLQKYKSSGASEDEILKEIASFTPDHWDQFIREAFAGIDSSLKDLEPERRKTPDKADTLINAYLAGPGRRKKSSQKIYPVFTALIQLILSHHFLPYTEIRGKDASIIEKKYIHGYDDIEASISDNKLGVYGTPSWYDPHWLDRVQRTIDELLETKARLRMPDMPTLLLYSFLFARPALVAADQLISAMGNRIKYEGDPENICFANPYDREKGEMAQTLARHLTGVGRRTARNMELLRLVWKGHRTDCIAKTPGQLKTVENLPPAFAWQAKAEKIAGEIHARQKTWPACGFFGVMAAATGTGKTRCIPTFMSHLQGEGNIRFTLALGLRTLTEQSGKDYVNINEIGFKENTEVSVLIGGEFQDYSREEAPAQDDTEELSDRVYGGVHISPDAIFPADLAGPRGAMSWNDNNDKLAKMLQVPILVCTVDHLMAGLVSPKADAAKRLVRTISSDLVIDEIDSFAIEDLRGLARLVFLTGAAGRRVLVSSATVSAILCRYLFESYLRGYEQYRRIAPEASETVHTAWLTHVPELCGLNIFTLADGIEAAVEAYYSEQAAACRKMITHLQARPVVRRLDYLDISDCEVKSDGSMPEEQAYSTIADRISSETNRLHEHFKVEKDGRFLSVGLIRFSQTRHALQVFRRMLAKPDAPDTKRVYVFYQAKLTDINLERVETVLNRLLKRKHGPGETDPIWSTPEVKNLIRMCPDRTDLQIVIVSTPIEEVGRDHDFDWGILEPTSTWSMLQTPGRILRHRLHRILEDADPANIVVLSHPMRALFSSGNSRLKPYSGPGPVKPGFELSENDARAIFPPEMKTVIDARYALDDVQVDHRQKKYDTISALEKSRVINDIGRISAGRRGPLLDNCLTHVSSFFDAKYPFRDDGREKIDVEVSFTDDGPKCRYLNEQGKEIRLKKLDGGVSSYAKKFLLNYSDEGYKKDGKFVVQASSKQQLKQLLHTDSKSQGIAYCNETGAIIL